MKKQIVFFCESPDPMTYKMAKTFKLNGYETVLLTISKKSQIDKEFSKSSFDKIICSDFQFRKTNLKNPVDLTKKIPKLVNFFISIRELNPYVMVGVSYTNWTVYLARKIFKKTPFIYFPYDISALRYPELKTALSKKYKFELKSEKYCFENADGILTKGSLGELRLLKKTYLCNLRMSPLKISFLPYCFSEFILPINKNKLSKNDGEIHIVGVGGLGLTSHNDVKFCIDLFQKLLCQKIHIHLYSQATNLDEQFSSLLKNRYFHLHNPLRPKQLISEISKYDFGFWPGQFRQGKNMDAYIYATGNRISTFLEAGLPFFYNPDLQFVDKIMKRYGLDLHLIKRNNLEDLKNFKKRIKKLNYKKLEKNVITARKNFNFDNHFPRLEKFIKQVVRRKHNSS